MGQYQPSPQLVTWGGAVAATRTKPPAVRALREFRSKVWGTISAKIEAVAVVPRRKSARVLYLLNILSGLLLGWVEVKEI